MHNKAIITNSISLKHNMALINIILEFVALAELAVIIINYSIRAANIIIALVVALVA